MDANGIELTHMGPVTVAMPDMMPMKAVNSGRWCRGAMLLKMITEPGKSPADPKPEIALPTINPAEDGVMAQISDPSSNNPREIR